MKSLRAVFGDIVDVEDSSSAESSHVIWIAQLAGEECGDRLRHLRHRLGMTQGQLSLCTSISERIIGKAESDPGTITLRDLIKICDFLSSRLADSLHRPAEDFSKAGTPVGPPTLARGTSSLPTGSKADSAHDAEGEPTTNHQRAMLADFSPLPQDQPSGIRRWSAAILGLMSTVLLVYGEFRDRQVIVLGFLGMVIAIPVALVVHAASQEAESKKGNRYYRRWARVLTAFALSYLMLLAVGIFYALLIVLIHFIQSADTGNPPPAIPPTTQSVSSTKATVVRIPRAVKITFEEIVFSHINGVSNTAKNYVDISMTLNGKPAGKPVRFSVTDPDGHAGPRQIIKPDLPDIREFPLGGDPPAGGWEIALRSSSENLGNDRENPILFSVSKATDWGLKMLPTFDQPQPIVPIEHLTGTLKIKIELLY